MKSRRPEDFASQEPDESILLEQPATKYTAGTYPGIAYTLGYLNQLAVEEEETALFAMPQRSPETYRKVQMVLQQLHEVNSKLDLDGLRMVSFDIDLTLRTGEDDEQYLTLIEPDEISRLQALGYIVGACSDRDASNQYETLQRLGQNPDFCIPREMLEALGYAVPVSRKFHVGDDRQRDKNVAEAAGWIHIWTDEYPA